MTQADTLGLPHQPAGGEHDLRELLRRAGPRLDAQTYVYCCVTDGPVPPALEPICIFRETEGLTAIVPRERAAAQGLRLQPEWGLITLAAHSALEAVGFLARITAALSGEGIAVNVVSAYHHDHLFVPSERVADAMSALERLMRVAA
ncbi:MAG: ACT domain-containing protein [Piscinibacter sp.]|uniref:ACT domain-containing protein n=1 Tax=Piscinibacter TaxID=1114981 RepID=UPI000FDE608A|nr:MULTISPECIES: ACT domain-containing protein [Piscinibacter]MCW5667491.1 ACT domain-containing protein [Piscinibacter sp.]